MWDTTLLIADACRVSQAMLPDFAELELNVTGCEGALMPTALHLDAGLRRLARTLDHMAATALDVSCGLQPQVERLWEGLVGVTAGRAGSWEPGVTATWQRASGHLEELSLILGVVADQVPRGLIITSSDKEQCDEQGQ